LSKSALSAREYKILFTPNLINDNKLRIESEIGPFLRKKAMKNLKRGLPLLVVSSSFLLLVGSEYSPFHVDFGSLNALAYFLAEVGFTYSLTQFLVPDQYIKSGLNGEIRASENLSDKLGIHHALFNDIMLKDGKSGGNIDHIIVGPRGIFVLETKNLKDHQTIYGDNWTGLKRSQSPSIQARENATRLYQFLDGQKLLDRPLPFIRAIVVLLSKNKPEIKKYPESCEIIYLKNQKDTSIADYVLKNDCSTLSLKEQEIIEEFLTKCCNGQVIHK
jgi:hypothetical protein